MNTIAERLRLWLSAAWACVWIVLRSLLFVFIVVCVLLFGWSKLHPDEDASEGVLWLGSWLGSLVPWLVLIAGLLGFGLFLKWRSQDWRWKVKVDGTLKSDMEEWLGMIGSLLVIAAFCWWFLRYGSLIF